MDVLRGVITEDDAYKMPMDIFKGIASISSEIVLKRINRYLEDANANEAVKRRVEEAYSEVMDKKNYYADESLIESAKEISTLSYCDITAGQPLDKLIKWREDISAIMNSPYAVAYIPPVRIESLIGLIEVIQARAKESPDNVYLYTVADELYANKTLFKDAPFKGYKGTPVKRIINDRTKYDVILRGLDFLIEKKRVGANPQTWRFM